jgi:NADPH:quinone reductase
MTDTLPTSGRALRSLISANGHFSLFLEEVETGPLAPGELLVAIEAAPVNPSDIGAMLGPADLASLRCEGEGETRLLVGIVPEGALPSVQGRLGQAMPVGLEGAGTVIAASGEHAHLVGRKVGCFGGGMYSQFRRLGRKDCIVLPENVSAREGASCFVNPQTALGMIMDMRRGGHSALVHTAAASNLGQMLNRICQEDGIGLVNIVRSGKQEALLRDQGAQWVCNSQATDFGDRLTDAIGATGATVAFDAVGGGTLAGEILAAMERAVSRSGSEFSRYGSATLKQVHIYGGLDRSPTVIDRSFGMAWTAGGWLLLTFLETMTPDELAAMRDRIAAGLKTIFASSYEKTLALTDLLVPDTIRRLSARGTGCKGLIAPNGIELAQ